jgi:hypothetical protein
MRQTGFLLILLIVGCGPNAKTVDEGGGDNPGGGGPGGCQGAQCLNFCPSGQQTSISGVVTAPNGVDPIPGALVYVPRALEEFPGEIACEICGEILANSLVLTKTNPDGTFTLGPIPTAEDQPPGTVVQVVAQKGRFRKVVDLPIASPCAANAVPDDTFRLPGRHEGHNSIPRIAVATGDYDAMECVLLKIGLEQGQFDLYEGSAFGGDPFGGGSSPWAGFDTLLNDPAKMRTYNIIFINCTSDTWEDMLAQETIRNNVRDYVAGGGRLYVTDWSYDWVEQVPEFSPVIDYEPGMSDPAPEQKDAATTGDGGEVVQADVLDPDMAEWLRAV